MTIAVDAVFENGVLRPTQPLQLAEHERVRIVIERANGATVSPGPDAEELVRRSFGLVQWEGDPEELHRFILDPELDPLEGP